LWLPSVASAQYHEAFEGPEVSWQLADRDCVVRVLEHARHFEQAHSGQASELIRLHAGIGSFAHWIHSIPSSRVIDEWQASVWVRANRPGLQIMARVVLPRSKDPRTGGPLKALLRGSTYAQPGSWQQLVIKRPAKLLRRHLPLLRAQFGPEVSAREAYIDLIVVNAYGGAGTTDLWLDDLQVEGLVDLEVHPSADTSAGDAASTFASLAHRGDSQQRRTDRSSLAMDGSILKVDNRPTMIRMIEYRGEPLATLKSLGFNAVRLSDTPTAELIQQAAEQEMWFMVPAPAGPVAELSEGLLERTIAWQLPVAAAGEHLQLARRSAQRLKSVPQHQQRPVVIQPPQLQPYSRVADILLLEPPSLNGSFPLADHGAWYVERSGQIRMGTPFWAAIPTQLGPQICAQIQTLGAEMPIPLPLEPQQVRLAAYHAVASGARGLLFRSRSPLDAPDQLTRLRACMLQWINHELELLEPWVAAGTYDGQLARGNQHLRVSALKGPRSRLLLGIRRLEDQQYVVAPAEQVPVSFDVYGLPATDEAYEVSARRLQRLPQQRAAGLRIALQQQQLVTVVLLTQDPLAISYLARQIERTRQRHDQLLSEVASQMYSAVAQTRQRLLEVEAAAVAANGALEQARVELQHFQRLVETGGHDRAYTFLSQGLDQLATCRYQDWQQAVRSFPTPVASPLCVTYFSLPEHYALAQRLRGASWGPNMLPGGDFENLALLQDTGWRNQQRRAEEARTSVELSVHAPYAGRSALRLQHWPAAAGPPVDGSGSPGVEIVTAPVKVQRGQLVRIHGWVRTAQPLDGGWDGLLITDSLGGRQLAHRVRHTSGWEAFTLFRAAADDGPLRVSFSLTGHGELWLDDVTICAIDGPGH
jgi:hypothetical protein